MPGGLTFFSAGQLLNHILRAVVPTYPATMYIRLLTTPSSKGVSGTETTYGGYARVAIVRGTGAFTDPLLTGRSTNVAALTFPQAASAGAGDLVAFDIVNTSAGVFTETYLYGNISPTRSVTVGKTVRFPIGALEVTA